MAATTARIRRWLERGKEEGATHVIVVTDEFDHNDFPVFIKPNESVKNRITYYDNLRLHRVQEVYNLSMDIEKQLNEYSAYNL